MNDKSVLMRKIEFFEKYGTMEGTHTEHRLKARMAGGAADRNNKEKMQKAQAYFGDQDIDTLLQCAPGVT